jgi:putative hydrolase of the HAD superfamily
LRYPYLLFDVGGTLVGPRESYGAVYRRALLRSGLDLTLTDVDRAIGQAAVSMTRLIEPGVNRFGHFDDGEDGFWRRFVALVFMELELSPLEPPAAEKLLEGLRDEFGRAESWKLFDDTLPTLRALASKGVRMAVVSNWDSRLMSILETLGLTRYFEHVACSAIEDSEKPAPLLFERALERLGAAPGQALHVGDVPDLDIEGARRAGIDAVLIDRDNRHPTAKGPRIDTLLRLIE